MVFNRICTCAACLPRQCTYTVCILNKTVKESHSVQPINVTNFCERMYFIDSAKSILVLHQKDSLSDFKDRLFFID